MSTAEIATIEMRAIGRTDDGEWTVEHMVAQAMKIQRCMEAVMVDGEHYGVIPGTQGRDGKPPKKTLLKPGAEKLCLMFRLCPEYETLRAEQSSTLISYTVRCILTHIPSGNRIATGLGSCNSREKKYTRAAAKTCPNCSKTTIFRSKNESEGWYCWRKKDGCGATFKPDDTSITEQASGVEDPSDLDNTILKMACKRALVAAVLNGTAASDCFTQDLEDLTEKAAEYTPPPAKEAAPAVGKGASTAESVAATARPANAPSPSRTSATSGDQPTTASGKNWAPTPKDYINADKVPVKAGDMAVHSSQVERIHILAKACLDEQSYRLDWVGKYKTHDGKVCESSKDLTFDQAANLIKRLTAHSLRQGARVERLKAEVGEVVAAVGRSRQPPTLQEAVAQCLGSDDDARDWLHANFGVEHVQELRAEQVATAFALLAKFGTDEYDSLESKARSLGHIR